MSVYDLHYHPLIYLKIDIHKKPRISQVAQALCMPISICVYHPYLYHIPIVNGFFIPIIVPGR